MSRVVGDDPSDIDEKTDAEAKAAQNACTEYVLSENGKEHSILGFDI
jgi:hypothetical protein